MSASTSALQFVKLTTAFSCSTQRVKVGRSVSAKAVYIEVILPTSILLVESIKINNVV